jgi:hypothetical protein
MCGAMTVARAKARGRSAEHARGCPLYLKKHNPYQSKLKDLLARIRDTEDFFENGRRCNRCENLEKDGFELVVSHVNDDGAQDRRRGSGNHYYKRLYDRTMQEYDACPSKAALSLELLCLKCHGNPKRTDKKSKER